MEIRIHKILKGSRSNGPGIRNVVWFQGCTINCPGCFNPLTHDPAGGKMISAGKLCRSLLTPLPEGITISGGEPFQQPEGLAELLRNLRQHNTPPILVFSGYPYSKLSCDPACFPCLSLIDALICGPYCKEYPPAYERFCSSFNQELILLSDRYSNEDFSGLPLREWIIGPGGETVSSGIGDA